MAIYGLTPTGFIPKTLEILLEEVTTEIKDSLGFVPVGALLKLITIVSERWAELWELGEIINGSLDPDNATGPALEALSALTGTFKDAASASIVTLTLTGVPGTSVLENSAASTLSTGVSFLTDEDVTIATLAAWTISTSYAVGARRTNSGNAYICIIAGTSAGSGGPTTTSSNIIDNTVRWRYMGEGTGAIDVISFCEITGPIVAQSGDITQIETPVFGWDGVINLLDALVGNNVETDGQLRLKRRLELTSSGDATADAIRADLLKIENVQTVTVFNNNSDITDVDGVPPHTVEILIQGGDDQELFDAILLAVPVGIGTFGTQVGSAVDSEGVSRVVRFSRPDEVEIYVDVELTKNANEYATDGDNQVKLAIVAFGQSAFTGLNAVASRISAQVFTVTGVLDVTLVQIGIAPSPSASTTIPIGTRQLATYDTSRITVLSVSGVP